MAKRRDHSAPHAGRNQRRVRAEINNRGEVAGYAENNIADRECPPKVAVNGTGPQVLDFEAVIWGPRQGEIRELRPLPGDTVGMAFGINDHGQAVGMSGSCANTVVPRSQPGRTPCFGRTTARSMTSATSAER